MTMTVEEQAEELAEQKFQEQSVRFVTKFPRRCLTSDEAVKVILSESKNHGVLDKDIAVGEGSPQWQKEEIVLRAEALRIINHHTTVPFAHPDMEWDEVIGLLLVENGGIVGAAGFTNKTFLGEYAPEFVNFEDYLNNWQWSFAFIDPQHRRKGYVSKRIPAWREEFGEFTSTRPWSEGARAMFEKMGWYPTAVKGEESLERTEAELRKIQLGEYQRAGRFSRRWIKEEGWWVMLINKK
jgi:hypothetical protein